MGVKGLFAFLNRAQIPGAIKEYSLDAFVQEIKDYQRNFGKRPKILINLRVFNNYYEQKVQDAVFGGRMNQVKQDFEKFLSMLQNAGADLMFISKKIEELWEADEDKQYRSGLGFVSQIKTSNVNDLVNANKRFRSYPWNDVTMFAMAQSAMKFGAFRENDCHLRYNYTGDVMTANAEDVFIMIGLDTSYLLFDGTWRLFYPVSEPDQTGQPSITFKEYDKKRIMKQYDMNIDQMQLFGVLSGKFISTPDNEEKLFRSFSYNYRKPNGTDFRKVIRFVHQHASPDKFPLKTETLKVMLREIFGYVNDELLKDFEKSLNFGPVYVERDEKLDEINELMRNNPYSTMAQKLLNNFTVCIVSFFLEASACDMKSLKDLTLPWIERACGVLFKNSFNRPARKVLYRVGSEKLKDFEIMPEHPTFDVPPLNQLLKGNMSSDQKYKMLAFLIDNLIEEDGLKDIPNEFLMHEIIVKHLVKNDSMTQDEARALNKTVKEETPQYITCPTMVDARLFRISVLYCRMFEVLMHSLYACGLEVFIADLKLDSVWFQINYSSGIA